MGCILLTSVSRLSAEMGFGFEDGHGFIRKVIKTFKHGFREEK